MPRLRIRCLARVVAALALLGVLLGAGRSAPGETSRPLFVVPAASPAPLDSLDRQVAAGEPLIVTLPPMRGGRPVESYRLRQAPAMSWLVDRSFFWRPRPEDVGTHRIIMRANYDAATPGDSLTVASSVFIMNIEVVPTNR